MEWNTQRTVELCVRSEDLAKRYEKEGRISPYTDAMLEVKQIMENEFKGTLREHPGFKGTLREHKEIKETNKGTSTSRVKEWKTKNKARVAEQNRRYYIKRKAVLSDEK